MLNEKVSIEDVKALLFSHEIRLESKRVVSASPLPSVDVSIRASSPAPNYVPNYSFNNNQFVSILII